MVEFGASIKVDVASAISDVKKFAASTRTAGKLLKKFREEALSTMRGGKANVFSGYTKSIERINSKTLNSIRLMHKQKLTFSELTGEQKKHARMVDKLNQKYDESAANVKKLTTIRNELKYVVASGNKTQKEADLILDKEAIRLDKSTKAYKRQSEAKRKAFEAGRRVLNATRKARVEFDNEFASSRKLAAIKTKLNLLLKAGIIDRKKYNALLISTVANTKRAVIENEKMISSQKRMAQWARQVSIYSRLLLGVYAAMRVTRAFVDFEKTAEAVKLLTQKLEFLTGDAGAYKKLFSMTQDVGVTMGSANKIISRFAVVTNRAFSIETMSEWSATLIKSARATGTSTQEMTGALIQITQAMSAGRLMGDEYRSVTENLPLLTVALRDMFGRSTSSLKELSSQGLLTNDVLIEAFGRTKVLLEGFPDSTKTIEASFGRLSSSWDNLVSSMTDSKIVKTVINELAEFNVNIANLINRKSLEQAESRIEVAEGALKTARKNLQRAENSKLENEFDNSGTTLMESVIKSNVKKILQWEGILEERIEFVKKIKGISEGDLVAKAMDREMQDERKKDAIYKQQLITLEFIDKIKRGTSLATINKKSELNKNILEDKLLMPTGEGGLDIHEYSAAIIIEEKYTKISVDKIIQTQIDGELRLKGFNTRNNIDKIEQELSTSGKITKIRNKLAKDILSVRSQEEARKIGLDKKQNPDQLSDVTAEKATRLVAALEVRHLKDIKLHLDGVTASINSIGASAQANTAKLKGDITGALGFNKAATIAKYNKSIVALEKQILQLGNSEELLTQKQINANDVRINTVKLLKEEMEAKIKKDDDNFASSLESKFDLGAKAVRAYNTEIIALTAAKNTLNLSEAEHNRQLEILRVNMEFQVNQSKSLRGELSQFEQVIAGMTSGMDKFRLNTKTTFETVAGATETLFDGMVDSIVTGGKEGEDAFKRMTQSILKDIQRMIIKSLVLKAIGMFTGGSTSSSFFQGADGAEYWEGAKGGIKSGPGISAYSNTIVNSPTVFPFAKGIGLMGEAGEEAIMPLTRMSNGNLGIESSGSGRGGDNNVTINVRIDKDGNAEQKTESSNNDGIDLGNVLADAVNQQLIKEMRPGGILNRRGG